MQFLSKKPFRLGLLAASAALLAVTVMFPVFGALEWFALVPFSLVLFFTAEEENRPRQRLCELALFFGVYFLILYHWFFYMYPMNFLGINKVAAAVVVVVAWFGLAFLGAAPAVLLFWLWKPLVKSCFVQRHKWLAPFLAASLWTVLEWVTTLTMAGVPWSRLALGQLKVLAVLQTASLFGSYFITFLIVSVNFLLGYVLFYRKRALLALPIALFSVNLIVGGAMLMLYENESNEPLKVAAVQGNVDSGEKWDADRFLSMLETHRDLTAKAAADGAEIVLWTESAVPEILDKMPSTQLFISQSAKDGNCQVLVGAFDADADGKKYNALFLFQDDGTIAADRYYKRRLVPFGEYTPFRGLVEVLIPPLAHINAFGEEFTAGTDTMLIETEYGRLGGLICFDSIYEELARHSVRDGAQILMISTNDSWFKDSAALSMHNGQAVLRAIENRRFVVRAANTGISSVITPKGEVLADLGALREGYLCENVYMHSDISPYTAVGNVFVAMCGCYLGWILIAYGIEKKKKAT